MFFFGSMPSVIFYRIPFKEILKMYKTQVEYIQSFKEMHVKDGNKW